MKNLLKLIEEKTKTECKVLFDNGEKIGFALVKDYEAIGYFELIKYNDGWMVYDFQNLKKFRNAPTYNYEVVMVIEQCCLISED